MITLTPAAINEIKGILNSEANERLRIAVIGGGCSGFSYEFSIAKTIEEDDTVVEDILVVDPMSFQYMTNATVDYVEELIGSSFRIDNPDATSTCGCGSSFSA